METWNDYNKRTNGIGRDLLEQELYDCLSMVLFYTEDGKKELYLPSEKAGVLLRAFCDISEFNTKAMLDSLKFHPDYRCSHIFECEQKLEGKTFVTSDPEVCDEILNLYFVKKNTVVWRYEKINSQKHPAVKKFDSNKELEELNTFK